MPRKNDKQKDTPELFTKVFKVINGQKSKGTYITVHRVAKEIHEKLEQMGLKPESREVLLQVRRALKYGVQKNLFLQKSGKYRIAIAEDKSKSTKKEVVPLDSLELMKSVKPQKSQVSKKSNTKKHRCTRQGHTSSCRKRNKKRAKQPNKRFLSRKCKGRYYIEPTSNKSSYESLSSDTSPQLGVSTDETTNVENKSESEESQKAVSLPASSDIHHWDNRQEAIDNSKYGKHSRKSRMHASSNRGSVTNSGDTKSWKNKKRRKKNLKEVENLSTDASSNGLSASTAIAAAIMIMMSLWFGYR